MNDPRRPQPVSSADDLEGHIRDLSPHDDEVDGVLGGDTTPPRDASTGMATGQRMHKPGTISG